MGTFPDPERPGKLVVELGYSRSGRQGTWADRKRWVLEDILGAVLREIEKMEGVTGIGGTVLGFADQVEPRQVWWQARPGVEGPVRQPGDPRDVRPLWTRV